MDSKIKENQPIQYESVITEQPLSSKLDDKSNKKTNERETKISENLDQPIFNKNSLPIEIEATTLDTDILSGSTSASLIIGRNIAVENSTNTSDDFDTGQSYSSSVILSPATAGQSSVLTRRQTGQSERSGSFIINTQNTDENDEWKVKPHYERRRTFNMVKYIISGVLIFLDVVFDWVEYFEMNNRGNYSIVAERTVKNLEFTVKCEDTGESVQFVFLIFTIVATICSIIQSLNIGFQMYYEWKAGKKDERIIHEYVETFVFLFFFEIPQIILIMGFYDVCTLDCNVDTTEIIIVVNGLLSFSKTSWRFFTSFRCFTVYWKIPYRKPTVKKPTVIRRSPTPKRSPSPPIPQTAQRPQRLPNQPTPQRHTDCCRSFRCSDNMKACLLVCMLPCLVVLTPIFPCILIYYCAKKCDVFDSRVGDAESEQSRWKCEESLGCCILRLFPSRFPRQGTKACECTCKTLLSCEQVFKCCIFRCYPTYLSPPKDDVFECKCSEYMSCERNCRCCILRCCPTYLDPPEDDFCTCRVADCIAREIPCKCFTFRCFPTHLYPPSDDIWTCRCRECLACEQNCTCCILRCIPSYLGKDDICTCVLKKYLACERSFACCLCRCFPSKLRSPKSDVFECTCGKCISCERNCFCCILRCCPGDLTHQEDDWCECTCCDTCLTCQEVSDVPSISSVNPSKPLCESFCSKCKTISLVVLIPLVMVLLIFLSYFLVVEIEFVLVCAADDSTMKVTQALFVQNYLKMFNIDI